MSDLQKQFGQRLRQFRLLHQITQQDLADRTHLSVGYISNLERGISAPSFTVIEILAVALEVKAASFFTFPDDLPTENRKRSRRS